MTQRAEAPGSSLRTPCSETAADAVRAALDPAYFSRQHFGWDPYPDPYQRDVPRPEGRRTSAAKQHGVLDAVLLHGKRRWLTSRRCVLCRLFTLNRPARSEEDCKGVPDNAARTPSSGHKFGPVRRR